jgi:hypothetical protein
VVLTDPQGNAQHQVDLKPRWNEESIKSRAGFYPADGLLAVHAGGRGLPLFFAYIIHRGDALRRESVTLVRVNGWRCCSGKSAVGHHSHFPDSVVARIHRAAFGDDRLALSGHRGHRVDLQPLHRLPPRPLVLEPRVTRPGVVPSSSGCSRSSTSLESGHHRLPEQQEAHRFGGLLAAWTDHQSA